MRGPLLFWVIVFYLLSLTVLVIPSFFLHKPDSPTGEKAGEGLFVGPDDLSSKSRLQMYLLFMIPVLSALNALFIYIVHYRHIRRQHYRLEANESDNLLFSTATRSLFSDKRLGRLLKTNKIEPLILYDGYNGVVPLYRNKNLISYGAKEGPHSHPSHQSFALKINLEASASHQVSAIDTSHEDGRNSTISPRNMAEGSHTLGKDWLTVEVASAPSKLVKQLRGRSRPPGVNGHGDDPLYRCKWLAASDVAKLVEAAQCINETSASIRYEIAARYAEVLESKEVIYDVVKQMNEEKRRRMRRRSATSLVESDRAIGFRGLGGLNPFRSNSPPQSALPPPPQHVERAVPAPIEVPDLQTTPTPNYGSPSSKVKPTQSPMQSAFVPKTSESPLSSRARRNRQRMAGLKSAGSQNNSLSQPPYAPVADAFAGNSTLMELPRGESQQPTPAPRSRAHVSEASPVPMPPPSISQAPLASTTARPTLSDVQVASIEREANSSSIAHWMREQQDRKNLVSPSNGAEASHQ